MSDEDKDFECNCCGAQFDEDVLMRGEIYPRKPDKCPECGAPESEISNLADKNAVILWPARRYS